MTASPSAARVLAIGAAFLLGACTNSPTPNELGRAEEPTLPPITTAPLATTLPPTTTTQPPSTATTEADDSTETDEGEEEVQLVGLDRIEELVVPLLGPTDSLSEAMNTIASFPRLVPTPEDAAITEVSVGTGTPADDGTVLTQLAVLVSSTADADASFNRIAGALQSAGLSRIDSAGESPTRSASFNVPSDDLFDEVVVSAIPNGEGSLVRVASNAAVRSGDVSAFIDWAGERLPLPRSDRQRTLVVVSTSGEGRLQTTNVSVESSVLIEAGSAQQEANRLIDRVADSEGFSSDADLEEDQPLAGPLRFDGLDEISYGVSSTTVINVDGEGELEDVEAVEIIISGSRRIQS